MVAEFEMGEEQLASSPLTAGSVALFFTQDMKGYGWLLRKGRFLNIGLGSLKSNDLRGQAVDFCGYLRRRGDVQEDVVRHLKGHAYLPYRNGGGRKIVGDGALLIGDAAGVSYPESGEGILPAVETAFLAARTVLGASGDYRQEKLTSYAAAVAARFGGKGTSCGGFPLPAAVTRMGGAAILSNGWLTKHLVLDRWFLHRGLRPLDLGIKMDSPAT